MVLHCGSDLEPLMHNDSNIKFKCPTKTTQDNESKKIIQCYCDNKIDDINDLFSTFVEYGTEVSKTCGTDDGTDPTDPWIKMNNELDNIIRIEGTTVEGVFQRNIYINGSDNKLITYNSSDKEIGSLKTSDVYHINKQTELLKNHIRALLCKLYNCTYSRKKAFTGSKLEKAIRGILFIVSIAFIVILYIVGMFKVISSGVMTYASWGVFVICNLIMAGIVYKNNLMIPFINLWVFVLVLLRVFSEIAGNNGWLIPFTSSIGGDSVFAEELFFNFSFSE
jgi:hypothetical protein